MVLPLSFFRQGPVQHIARTLLGKHLCTRINKQRTTGIITETEAYEGHSDKACHAYIGKTQRTAVMYKAGGIAYVYLCYGMYPLFNIVSNQEGIADAILIRSIKPIIGIKHMQERRPGKTSLGQGPGVLAQSLGIQRKHSALALVQSNQTRDAIWLEERKHVTNTSIQASKRIGLGQSAQEAADFLWRFSLIQHK